MKLDLGFPSDLLKLVCDFPLSYLGKTLPEILPLGTKFPAPGNKQSQLDIDLEFKSLFMQPTNLF